MKQSITKAVIGASVFGYTALATLLAQTDMPTGGIPAWVKEVSAVAALVWYLWYTQAISIPRIASTHRDTQKDLTEAFREEQKAARDAHERAVKQIADSVRMPDEYLTRPPAKRRPKK